MTTPPPELKPDPLPGVAAELSKGIDSIERRLDQLETYLRKDIAALRQEIAALQQEHTARARRCR